jgi:hypothetical protein
MSGAARALHWQNQRAQSNSGKHFWCGNPALSVHSNNWLVDGRISSRTVRSALAIRANTVILRKIEGKYIKGNFLACRACGRPGETMIHIVSMCKGHLADQKGPGLFMTRHNGLCRIMYNYLCFALDLECDTRICENPPPVIRNNVAAIWWDFPFVVDGNIQHYRPDIVCLFELKGVRTLNIIEIAVTASNQLERQYDRKRWTYAYNSTDEYGLTNKNRFRADNLLAQLKTAFQVQEAKVIPIIVGVGGETLKGFRSTLAQALPQLSRRRLIDLEKKLQRAAVSGSHRILMTHLALPEPESVRT